MKSIILNLVLTLLLLWVHPLYAQQKYEEEVIFRRIDSGKSDDDVVAHFQLSTQWQQGSGGFQWDHYNLFPKELGQIISAFDVEYFQLSFSKGDWDHEKWGSPFVSVPSGVEVFASLEDRNISSFYG